MDKISKNNGKTIIRTDVAIIGGGPAGMMAAVSSAESGAKVILLEKNPALGRKLLITGGGRCNVTNATFDSRKLAEKYGKKGKFLLSSFSKWDAKKTIDFFETNGMKTKIEAENRVFPMSNTAQSVWDVLVEKMNELGVTVLTDSTINKITSQKNRIVSIETEGSIIFANSFILATGGIARGETGSTGDGFKWLKKLGHTISKPSVALVPVKTKELWSHKLQGLSMPNVKITQIDAKERSPSRIGKILFTHFGLSGPLILNMSQAIGESLQDGNTTLELDLFPTLDHSELDERLREHLLKSQNKKWSNALTGFVSPLLAPVLVELSGINPTLEVNKLPRAARLLFVKKIKALTITPTELLGKEKAIVSSGGVSLEEIDFKTMRSKKIENLFPVGDILDFDRPSGGFSLQICWATGFIAGKNAIINS